jgi:Secretion system C-terminal sorting domain
MMMKIILCISLCLFLNSFHAYSQSVELDKKRDYQWVFGYRYTKYSMNLMDFSHKPTKISGINSLADPGFLGATAAICDTAGHFILYTNGCMVMNNNLKRVLGSETLNKGPYKDAFCKKLRGFATTQTGLFLPNAEKDNLYSLFHTTVDERGYCHELMYSNIDIKEDKTLILNKKIIEDSLEYKITAVRHANGKDWWVFMCSYTKDKEKEDIYYRVLVTKDTMRVFKQTFGKLPKKKEKYYSQVCFSPDGTKFARYREQDSLYIFDFDRATGLLSKRRGVSTNEINWFHGVAFSSDSRFVYALADRDIFQIDTHQSNLEKGKELIAQWDGFKLDGFPSSFGDALLAPDCKIYITTQGTMEYLSVINYPNRKGKASGVTQHSLKFPTTIAHNLPNIPQYRLGAIGEKHSPCDSTISPYIVANNEVINETQPVTFAVYPNPAQDHINVDLFGYVNRYERGTWDLYNLAGAQVISFPLFQGHAEYNFDISSIPNGVYVWRVSFNGVPTSTSGKVVVLRE